MVCPYFPGFHSLLELALPALIEHGNQPISQPDVTASAFTLHGVKSPLVAAFSMNSISDFDNTRLAVNIRPPRCQHFPRPTSGIESESEESAETGLVRCLKEPCYLVRRHGVLFSACPLLLCHLLTAWRLRESLGLTVPL